MLYLYVGRGTNKVVLASKGSLSNIMFPNSHVMVMLNVYFCILNL